MQVAYNASSLLLPLTGVGHYARSLAAALVASQDVDMAFFYASRWSRELIGLPAAPVSGGNQTRSSHWKALKASLGSVPQIADLAQQWRFSSTMPKPRAQLYHEPNFLPFRFPGPTVITAHDLSWLRYPQAHPADRVAVMNRRFPRALEVAAHVITDADYTREEIIAQFGISPDRISSVPLGARENFHPRLASECQVVLSQRSLSYRGYVLCVGTLEPRKNLELVIHAYAAMPEAYRTRRPLVLVGMKGWLTSGLESLMQPLVAAGQIRPQGYISDEELAALYAAAQVLVYPSLYEGFGLPRLEAMASGTPVIVSDRSTLPEVVGEAGVQIDAADESGLCAALRRFNEDAAWWNARAVASLAQAQRFSWARCARETLGVYRKVLDEA